jgi:UDP-4-keto-D-QuiNAc 4-reductase
VILVTGASGFVGAALLPALVDRGDRVCVLTRRGLPVPSGVEVRSGDLLVPPTLPAALRGATTVIHLAAALPGNGVSDGLMRQTNIDGTGNLARAAAAAGIQRFIHMSSAGVYGDGADLLAADENTTPRPETPYERSKLDAEDALVAALDGTTVSVVVLRPSGIHGPTRDATVHFYTEICRRRVWVHGPASVIVHPTYVGDVISAVLAVLDRPLRSGAVFNIAGAEALTYRDLIDRVARRLHVRTHQVQFPAPPIRALARLATVLAPGPGRSMPALARLQRPLINRSVDISRARAVLGFEPCSLDAAIDATIAGARREGRL